MTSKIQRVDRDPVRRKKCLDERLPLILAALLVQLLLVTGCGRRPEPVTTVVPSPTPQPNAAVIKPTIPARLPEGGDRAAFVELAAVGGGNEAASVQNPGFLAVEMTGRQISNVSFVAGALVDGRQRVLVHQPIDPDPHDELWPGAWADGVHDIIQTWDFTGDYLWDGQNGDFVVLWTTDPTTDTRTVHGRFRAAGEESYRNAVMVINTVTGLAEGIVDTSSGEAFPFSAGDEFQLTELILDTGGELHSEPGLSLSHEEGGHLVYTKRPVPNGTYFLQASAETVSGDIAAASVRYEVNNDTLRAGYKAYLQPRSGFQLLYPETWPSPTEEDGGIRFHDSEGTVWMNLSTHPDMSDEPILDLKQQALEAYGDVSVLYEDQIQIGQSGGLRTVYGYESAAGPRTGILLTFALDNQAYLVDIDGPSEQEATLLDIAGVVADSWITRAVAPTSSGHWTEVVVDGLPVAVPADFRPQQMSNGWIRLGGADELTFLALRSEPAAGRGLFEGIEHWLGVAGGNVYEFSVSNVYSLERDEQGWSRVDFDYTLDSGEKVSGAIMVTLVGDRFLIFWVEAPAENFSQYDSEVVLTIVDDVSRNYASRP